jgi:hypothetical protein
MSENIKSLVIKVKPKSTPAGKKYEWDTITDTMPSIIKDIVTPEISVDENGKATTNLGAIVSGMPTAFARANLFKLALDYVTDKEVNKDGLFKFYDTLVDEWRGFIGAIALDNAGLNVRRVSLGYSDGKKINETSNIYEPKGAFGNILFHKKHLWCDPSLAQNEDKIPFIDVIQYQDKVVGGTSPDSFLFTSVAYKVDPGMPFVSKQTGKFTDPLNSELTQEQVNFLYSYVTMLLNKIQNFRAQYNALSDDIKPSYANIDGNLSTWRDEIEKYSKNKNYEIKPTEQSISKFKSPFSALFNHSTTIFGREGLISTEFSEGAIEFDPRNILLPDSSQVAEINFGNMAAEDPSKLKEQPIYVMRASVKGENNHYSYFALPLTALGLNVFGENLGTLVGMDENGAIKSRLTGVYDAEHSVLEAELKLFTQDGKEYSFKGNYPVGKEIHGQDVLMWPDFISKQWNRYFLYSEMPHNNSGYQAIPFVGDTDSNFFRIIIDDNGEPVYLASDGRVGVPEKFKERIKCKLHIGSDDRVADNQYKYEIFESNQPFKGIKFRYANKDCGYVIIRYNTAVHGLPKNWLNDHKDLADANLGIDFGSTNSSVAYYSHRNHDVCKSMTFKNRRISLFADDNKNNDIRPAMEDEVFFFQNDEIRSNSIKSILTIQDEKRIIQDANGENVFAQAVKGGFPCFEKNLPIESASEKRYNLKFPKIGNAQIVYNMKWATDDRENDYKTAYLSSLLLHVYAQMFEENHIPIQLKWSFPSAMSANLRGQYRQIWATLDRINPIYGGKKLEVLMDKALDNLGGVDVWSTTNGAGESSGSGWGNSNSGQSSGEDSWEASVGSAWGQTHDQTASQQAGWGNEVSKQNAQVPEINSELTDIKFDFRSLDANESITEAVAVANYLANQTSFSKQPNNLTLCFDVGGSTTDISALCNMRGPNGAGIAMVKQNSIRFAAQRIAFATKYSPNFKSVLFEMCSRKNISIQGLNKGEDKYSPDTAPYYFEQLVDRLDESDFPGFYQLIRGKCPELMSVNVYVTGLIMYYAGQLSYKLITELRKSDETQIPNQFDRVGINVVFAGKGARIFDWFKLTDAGMSEKYYRELFISGFGGMEKAQQFLLGPPVINPTNQNDSSNVKYEVSKGLAYNTHKLLVPKNKVAIEILGEDGFKLITKSGSQALRHDSSITASMMQNIEMYFVHMPEPGQPSCPRFMQFAGMFFELSTNLFGLKMSKDEFMRGFSNMNICAYIRNMPEYREAQKDDEKFSFVAPIIILEGMKFLEESLLPVIQKT